MVTPWLSAARRRSGSDHAEHRGTGTRTCERTRYAVQKATGIRLSVVVSVTEISHRPRYQILSPEEVATLLNKGTIAGVTRSVYRPVPIDYTNAEAKISEHDGAIRRKLQLPLRGMIANPQWALQTD